MTLLSGARGDEGCGGESSRGGGESSRGGGGASADSVEEQDSACGGGSIAGSSGASAETGQPESKRRKIDVQTSRVRA